MKAKKTGSQIVKTLNTGWLIKGFESERGLAEKAYKEDYQPENAISAVVPGTVRTALFKHGKIPDPYVGFNSIESEWVEEREWWYFKDFLTPETVENEKVFIRFEGITYRAEVWINGVQIGRIEGMFRTGEFDVTDYLNEKSNRLTIRVRTQENAHLDNSRTHRQLKGKIRSQGAVAQSMYKWNWSPHMVCVGLWRPVKILVKQPVEVKSVQVRTLSADAGGADGFTSPCADAELVIDWWINNTSGKPENIKIKFTFSGASFDSGNIANDEIIVNVPPNCKKKVSREIKISNARLWWPNGAGKPELHKLESEISSLESGKIIQEDSVVFGIRKITFERNVDQDRVIESSGHSMRPWSMIGELYNWTFVVNGRKIFLKGSNWVMLDAMLRLEEWRYDRQLSLVRDGGLNFLRIWGGSLAETDEFYDLCDRYGILCWQEFWLACADYPAMNHDVFIRCVRDTVQRLINHPSLVYYSGGNEYEPDNRENKGLVDKIAAAVAKVDPEREFRRGSPYKGDKHGGLVMTPYCTRNKYLDILYGDKRNVLMRSEVATGRSMPVWSSMDKFLPPESRWPIDEKLWRHFHAVPAEFIMFANEYDALDNFYYAVNANHLAHIQICRTNLEFCRSRMFQCSGNLNWQFNVPWPCAHRELADAWGSPKPAYYHYIKASRPVAAFIDIERYLWRPGEILNPSVYVANDKGAIDKTEIKTVIYAAGSSSPEYEQTINCRIPGNTGTRIGELDYKIPKNLSGESLLIKTELSSNGKKLYENWYWIAVSIHEEPEHKIDLCGTWRRTDGSELQLPGNDLSVDNPSFEYVILKQGDSAELETASGSDGKISKSQTELVYSRKFTISKEMQGMDLEFFTPGFESSDEVFVNGEKIGEHEFKSAYLDTTAWAFVPDGREKHDINLDSGTEYRFYSDPIAMPKLKARFYDIPQKILNTGENEIVIRMKSDYQKSCPYPMEVRPVTPNRKKVSEFLKRGVFFSGLRKMPAVELKTANNDREIKITNPSRNIAFMVILEVIPDATGIAIPLDDNAFTLLPDETKILKPLQRKKIPKNSEVRISGWNIRNNSLRI